MSLTEKHWDGVISIHQRRGWFVGTAGLTGVHFPHAIKICFIADGGDGTFKFRLDESEIWIECQAAIFAPDQVQQVDACGQKIGLFYILAETVEGQNLINKYLKDKHGVQVLPVNLFADLSANMLSLLKRRDCSKEKSDEIAEQMFQSLGVASSTNWCENFDGRILKAIEYIHANVVDKIYVEELAQYVASSISTLAHKFKEHTNLAIRRYQIWIRLQEAYKCMSISRDLKFIAHCSGFCSKKHFDTYFEEMHGVAPSILAERCKVFDFSDS